MKKFISYFLMLLIIAACEQRPEQQEDDQDTLETNETDQVQKTDEDQREQVETGVLEKLWETDTLMLTSESVLYDKERDRLYVSNINGQPTEEDANGFISTVNLDGEVLFVYFFSGYLDAPKGMAINNGKLYVTNIDELVEISIEDRTSNKSWVIDTAKFLNDVAAGPDGTIYFSDSETNTIYSLQNENVEVFLNSSELNGPNGLYIDGNTMMVATMNGGQLLKINMDNKSIEVFATGIGAGDGIVPTGDGRYLASSWNGRIFLIDEQGNKKTILDTRDEDLNAADIEYIPEKNLLLVPTFKGSTVAGYRLNLDNVSNNQNQ
ncbi:MAG: SMP-30/gluconolactonase/LRE family protein [Candidatus Cyclobacteriaceae bacterium M2_1C_046]